jgi:dolichyl-phosphate beta-glucosyltransferase
VLIPAYNEQDRILPTLQAYTSFLRGNYHRNTATTATTASSQPQQQSWRIVVIDDGSTDSTVEVVQTFAAAAAAAAAAQSTLLSNGSPAAAPDIRCLSLPTNQGKGAALAAGIISLTASPPSTQVEDCGCSSNIASDDNQHSGISLVLTADADGSADIAGLLDLLAVMKKGDDSATAAAVDLVCGYRTYDDDAAEESKSASASPLSSVAGRKLFRWGFRTTVRLLLGEELGCHDTQCGFKLMTRSAAVRLYSDLHLRGWSHDVEVLYRAKLLRLRVAEAPVRWQDRTGSKLAEQGVFKVATRMGLDVILCRLSYSLGWWKV